MSSPARIPPRNRLNNLRVLARFQQRLERARPGSVLILVVALLVLMALMGTAFISTSRTERYSAQQNSFNTEVDLLLDAVVKLEQMAILNGSGSPINTPGGTDDATIWTSPVDAKFFGDRIPVSLPGAATGAALPGWAHVASCPIAGLSFESPYNASPTPGVSTAVTYSTTTNLAATWVTVKNASGTMVFPALMDSNNTPYLAASASGDGIADAPLWRLPIGEVNGVTYYAGVRVCDNSSAINASIAYEPNPSTALPGDFFPTNVDLAGMLQANTQQMSVLNNFRWNGPNANPQALDDKGNPVNYTFVSPYEAMWSQLGRRLDNPGVNTSIANLYQALPIGESVAMAHRGCLANGSASPSVLEQAFFTQILPATVPSVPYGADQVTSWFNNNFVYDTAGQGNFRPLLVARNQVSNISASRFNHRSNTNPALGDAYDSQISYNFGDWVTQNGKTYVCIQDMATVVPVNDPLSSVYWEMQPWLDYPVKTSINTATFGQLWLAYWSVMSEQGPDKPADSSGKAMFRNPIRSAITADPNPPAGGGVAGATNVSPADDPSAIEAQAIAAGPGGTVSFAAGQYSINRVMNLPADRHYVGGPGVGGGTVSLTPAETMRLRAALAAINTEQLRSDNSRILSRFISVGGSIQPSTPVVTGTSVVLNFSNGSYISISGGSSTEMNGFTFDGGGGSGGLDLAGGVFNIHDNTFQNISGGSYVAAITVQQVHDGHFNNNVFFQVANGAEGITGFPGSNNTYDNNTFDYTYEPIHLNSGTNSEVANNTITHASRIAIELQNKMDNLKVENNSISEWVNPPGQSHMALSCATGGADNVDIGGNILILEDSMSTANMAGIEVFGSNVTVHDNYCKHWGCFILDGAWKNLLSTNNIIIDIQGADIPNTPDSWDAVSNPVYPTIQGDRVYGANDPNAPPVPAAAGGTQVKPPPTLSNGTPASLSLRVMLFGTAQQPYITEVYANNDSSTGGGYIAFELYNPYNTTISLKNWRLATINRTSGISQLTVTARGPADLSTLLASIGPYQRVVFASPTPPGGVSSQPSVTPIVVADLSAAFDNELVILRPRDTVSGTLGNHGKDAYPLNYYDETNVADLVPVDSYDFSGLPAASDGTNSTAWHYIRPNDQAAHHWDFVYPYRYSTRLGDNPQQESAAAKALPQPRLFGTWVTSGQDPVDLSSLGSADSAAAGGASNYYNGKEYTIQINNTDFGGPKGAPASQFPYGAFARNGDLLQTTYIGSYRVDLLSSLTDQSGNVTYKEQIIELNPVTMDSAFVDDSTITTDPAHRPGSAQNLGRFTPVHPGDTQGAINDFDPKGTPSSYHFATRLYDFLSVHAPADDYMPNAVAPETPAGAGLNPVANVKSGLANAYPNGGVTPLTTEDAAPTDGLVNINTAPWPVLAALPLANNFNDRMTIAKAIVAYREKNGPFHSILGLNAVPVGTGNTSVSFRETLGNSTLGGFSSTNSQYGTSGYNKGLSDADLSPYSPTLNDQVAGDFKKQFLAFNRISNLVTVRSDAFTAYVIVQGWRNVGTSTPELVVQRRAAFIADRSGSVPNNKTLNVTNIYAN